MNRPVTFDGFCARCEGQGRSLVRFSRLHADPRVQEYCQVADGERRWAAIEPQMAHAVDRVHQLEAIVDGSDRRHPLLGELHSLYRFTFEGFRLKGIVDALNREVPSASSPGKSSGTRSAADRRRPSAGHRARHIHTHRSVPLEGSRGTT
jgi:hypothetical protein